MRTMQNIELPGPPFLRSRVIDHRRTPHTLLWTLASRLAEEPRCCPSDECPKTNPSSSLHWFLLWKMNRAQDVPPWTIQSNADHQSR